MILLFTDFGAEGPYLGQMEAVLRQEAPGVPIINLLSNAPAGDPVRSSYLLAALAPEFPEASVFLAVVDPGVGSERRPVAVRADGRWFVGPDNGLFNSLAVQARYVEWFEIQWRPQRLSASFHGRDLFAPVAAKLALGDSAPGIRPCIRPSLESWPADLPEIVYVDHYGNAISGLRYAADMDGRSLSWNGLEIPQGRTFSSVAEGQALWYCNSIGLVEIAVNRGRADTGLGLGVGAEVRLG
jgi:S-adenosylmethionine hydrolase